MRWEGRYLPWSDRLGILSRGLCMGEEGATLAFGWSGPRKSSRRSNRASMGIHTQPASGSKTRRRRFAALRHAAPRAAGAHRIEVVLGWMVLPAPPIATAGMVPAAPVKFFVQLWLLGHVTTHCGYTRTRAVTGVVVGCVRPAGV